MKERLTRRLPKLSISPPDMPITLQTVTDITKTLNERGQRYGKFHSHASIAMRLKFSMRYEEPHLEEGQYGITLRKGWANLSCDQAQALDIICDKIARILNGDPNYIDNWHDIQGYAKLIEDRLRLERKT